MITILLSSWMNKKVNTYELKSHFLANKSQIFLGVIFLGKRMGSTISSDSVVLGRLDELAKSQMLDTISDWRLKLDIQLCTILYYIP